MFYLTPFVSSKFFACPAWLLYICCILIFIIVYELIVCLNVSANHFQVTALLAFGQYLYASTTLGCIIVADAVTMTPKSVFRCHGNEEFYCKAILPVGPTLQIKKQTSDNANDNNVSEKSKNSGVVTIGRGYEDVIKRVIRLDSQVFDQNLTNGWPPGNLNSSPTSEPAADSSDKSHTFVLSWDPKHWNYYWDFGSFLLRGKVNSTYSLL